MTRQKQYKLCKHDGCNNTCANGRRECYKCRSKFIRERKPVDMVFYWLKESAKKRALQFSIELNWFREWISESGYMQGRGRLTDSLTIDRKDNLLGYVPGNLQILTKTDNVKKFHHNDEVRDSSEPLPF